MTFWSKLRFGTIVILFLCGVSEAQRPQERGRQINITAYEVFQQDYEKPLLRLEHGIRRTYKRAYVVQLKGNFGEPRAIPADIFIGDYRVPEYGETTEGIYFRIYDEKLLLDLEGRPFAYGFQGQKVKTFDLRFVPSSRRPFSRITKFP